MDCQELNHEKGKCQCCCSITQIGCIYCVLPVLGHKQIKKIIRERIRINLNDLKNITSHVQFKSNRVRKIYLT